MRLAAKAAMVRNRQGCFAIGPLPADQLVDAGGLMRPTLDQARAEVPAPLLSMFDDRVATHVCRFRLQGMEIYPELAFSVSCGGSTAHYYTDGQRDVVYSAGITKN